MSNKDNLVRNSHLSPNQRDVTPTRLGRASTIISPTQTRLRSDVFSPQNIHSSSIGYMNGHSYNNNGQ